MADPATNQLMQRVLRFLDYNAELYRQHRERGDYRAAVQRLERVSKLVDVADQAEREGKCQLSWMDWATLSLARQHSAIMLDYCRI
jgi:hypothetical protein